MIRPPCNSKREELHTTHTHMRVRKHTHKIFLEMQIDKIPPAVFNMKTSQTMYKRLIVFISSNIYIYNSWSVTGAALPPVPQLQHRYHRSTFRPEETGVAGSLLILLPATVRSFLSPRWCERVRRIKQYTWVSRYCSQYMCCLWVCAGKCPLPMWPWWSSVLGWHTRPWTRLCGRKTKSIFTINKRINLYREINWSHNVHLKITWNWKKEKNV